MSKAPTPSRTAADELVSEYELDLRAQGVVTTTLRAYVGDVRDYLKFLALTNPIVATRVELRAYLVSLHARKLRAKTIHCKFVSLSSFYQWLEEENRIALNPVPSFRKRYLKTIMREVSKNRTGLRKLVTIEEMSQLAHSILDTRDRAILILLAKTGIRRMELVTLDVNDVNWRDHSLNVKPHPKRTNTLVLFDDEAARALQRWLPIREARGATPTKGPLFIGNGGGRLDPAILNRTFANHAELAGLHDPDGCLKERFTPHCCRHWFTTVLQRSGMKPEYRAWLRGDAAASTQDLYIHVDPQAVREAYDATMPQLGT